MWIDKVEKRYAQISTHYPDKINDFVATIKSKSGPLFSSIRHKTGISEIFQEIRHKYLSGTEAIDILFNIKSTDFKEALDTGKCISNLENFLFTAELVIKHQLQILITAKQLDQISNALFLHNDITDYNKFKGQKNLAVRGDSMTTKMSNLVDNLRHNTNSSMLNMSHTNCQIATGFYETDDIDIEANMSIMAGRGDKDIVSELTDLVEYAVNMR